MMSERKVMTLPRAQHFDASEDVAIVFHDVSHATGLHVHEFFEMVYVERGVLLHQYGPAVHEVRAGDFFIVDPTVPHGYSLTPTGPAQIWNVILTERALNMLALQAETAMMIGELVGRDRHALSYRRLRLRGDLRRHVDRIVKEMETEFRQKKHGYQVALKGYLITLVGLISRALQEGGMALRPASSPQSKLGDVTRYIVEHCDRPLSVKQLADQHGWTPDHLNRLLKKAIGETVQGYIGRIRAARAASLLLVEGMTVAEVAKKVGYADARAFRRAFRRYYGVSPSQFRRSSFREA